MGKISRRKPPRPPSKTMVKPAFNPRALFERHEAEAELGFAQACTRLRLLFTQFAAEDVIVAINVSDLWPPNISAQVKHQLAFAVCLSIPPAEFSLTRLQSYEEFGRFARALIDILPRFPSLEDYWPESDWGDVKFTDALDARPCFYGGTVQRICDFIEAFQILHGDASDAVRDMRYARQMQAALLETVRGPSRRGLKRRVQGIWRCPSRLLGVDQVGTSDSNALRDDGKPHNDTWFANRLAQRARIRQCRDVGRRYSLVGSAVGRENLALVVAQRSCRSA